ncbi:MAG: hypothetical protein EOL92_00435 [Bacteroidia bacterium]|nr:hypothetical protein [Bacteroidia bacterium]
MSNYLRVVKPITVTSAMMTACDVPETDHAAWSSATTYGEGARVIKSNKIWESAAGSNTNHDPEEDGTTWWIFVSHDNRWKALDLSTSSRTVQSGSMSYTLTPGRVIGTVALLNLSANSVRVRVVDPVDGVVYDTTKSLRGIIPESDWWNWFFSDVYPENEVIFNDLPTYGTADIIIDIDAGSGTAAVGVLALGVERSLNFLVLYGVSLGMLDFSRKERDDFGEVRLMQGNYAETMEIPCMIANVKIPTTRKMLQDYRATPCIWMADGIHTIFGWYNDFSIQINYPMQSEASITIEGLI